jgi:hypothetical protein
LALQSPQAGDGELMLPLAVVGIKRRAYEKIGQPDCDRSSERCDGVLWKVRACLDGDVFVSA